MIHDTAEVLERLAALRALVWRLAAVRMSLMNSKVANRCVRLVALIARVGSLAGVTSFMYVQLFKSQKSLIAMSNSTACDHHEISYASPINI